MPISTSPPSTETLLPRRFEPPSSRPSFTPAAVTAAHTSPMTIAGPHTETPIMAKESPTAMASMLVATASMTSCHPRDGSPEEDSSSSPDQASRSMLTPTSASRPKAIQ